MLKQMKDQVNELIIEVYGRVQGIGFRYYVKKNADKLELKGYVKNREDGSVLINVWGKKEDLDLFLNAVRKGPTLAEVEEVKVSDSEKKPNNKYDGFTISLENE